MSLFEIIIAALTSIVLCFVSVIYTILSFKEIKILNMRKKEFELRVCILESEVESLKDVVYNVSSK